MSTVFFVSVSPASGEQSSYFRQTTAFTSDGNSFPWGWAFDTPQASTIKARMVIDGVAGPWISPVNNIYTFNVNVPNGHHIAYPETELAGSQTFGQPFIVNNSASALPTQTPWVAQRRVPGEYSLPPIQPKQITTIPTVLPFRAPMKTRTPQIYTTRQTADTNGSTAPMAQLWGRRWTGYHRSMFSRRWWKTPKGDYLIAGEQRYEYGNATSLGSYKAGLQIPAVQVRDGPRGYGILGYVAKLMLRRGGKGVYFLETDGRLGHMQFKAANVPPPGPNGVVSGEGYINTFVGWRVKENDYPVWAKDPNNPTRNLPDERGWEYRGNWSRMGTAFPQRWHEPWGFAVAFRKADGTIDNRDGLDMWVCDTLNMRIAYVDNWALHADVSSVTGHPSVPNFPPPGYVFPGHVAEAQVVPFLENLKEPWDCDVNPVDGKLYFTEFAGDKISRVNLDGTGLEVICGFVAPLTDAQLGIPQRLYPSQIPLATLRSTYLIDGPANTARVTRPQAIAFDAAGNLFWTERYTFAVRKWDRVTKVVTTIKQLPVQSIGIGSSETHDFAMCIDVEGTTGPAGDIFVSGWAGGAHWRIAANGSWIANIAGLPSRTLRNGPGDYVDPPNYAWGISVAEGRIIWSGNDSTTGQLIEYTKKQSTDGNPNQTTFDAGANVWRTYFLLTHGHDGYNDLGYPNIEEMGSWGDPQITNYATAWGVPVSQIANLIYYIRWSTTDFDYSSDTTPPGLPVNFTVSPFTWSMNMYNAVLQATAPADADVKALRFYADGVQVAEVSCGPNQTVQFTYQHPGGATVQLGCAAIDAVPNVSAQATIAAIIPPPPDIQAPAAPSAFNVVSIVWVP